MPILCQRYDVIVCLCCVKCLINYGLKYISMQNGTAEEVKKIVTTLNEAEVPSEDDVGELMSN